MRDLQPKKRHGDGGPGEASYGSSEPSQEECVRDEDMLGEFFQLRRVLLYWRCVLSSPLGQ